MSVKAFGLHSFKPTLSKALTSSTCNFIKFLGHCCTASGRGKNMVACSMGEFYGLGLEVECATTRYFMDLDSFK